MEICNLNQTRELAKAFSKILVPPMIVLLKGDLGSGKTTFVKDVVAALGSKDLVTSPTFTLMNTYNAAFPIYHFDVYRLSNTDEFYAIGGDEYFENGKDSVQIYIRTNIGENESELVKIASGGEMSRIMLAIKKVIAEADEVPVMIFDEIDTGISGKAANAVADKMKSISKNHQVLCISHLAAIAASANYNYFISKKVENERTATKVKLLNEKEVLCEIARISSGEVNEVTLQYANELRKKVS